MIGLVDWELLVLFIGLFVVNHALQKTGLPQRVVTDLAVAGVPLQDLGPLIAISFVLSNIGSNVPAVMLLLPIVAHTLAGPTLALVSTPAGYLLIVGSVANIIVVDAQSGQACFRKAIFYTGTIALCARYAASRNRGDGLDQGAFVLGVTGPGNAGPPPILRGKELLLSDMNVFYCMGAFGLACVFLWLSQFSQYMTGNPPSVYDGTAFGQHLFARPAIADEHAQGHIERRRTSADSTAAGVMGHRGHGLLGRWLIGSVAKQVMFHAPCAVLVAR